MDAEEDLHVVRSRLKRVTLTARELLIRKNSSFADSAAGVADITTKGDFEPCSQTVPTTGGSEGSPTKLESGVSGGSMPLLLDTTMKESEKIKKHTDESDKSKDGTTANQSEKIKAVSTATLPETSSRGTPKLAPRRSINYKRQYLLAQENARNASGEKVMEVLTSGLPETTLSKKRSPPASCLSAASAAHQEKENTPDLSKRTKSSALKQESPGREGKPDQLLQGSGSMQQKRRSKRKRRYSPTSSESQEDPEEDEEMRENIAESLCAVSLGFPPNALSMQEIQAGVAPSRTSLEVGAYIQVRNHILGRWRSNVHAWLALETVRGRLRTDFFPLADVAYKFLSTFGYINFGVAPALKSHIPHRATKAKVVVIGAGLAGLAAARQLKVFGHEVVVLEARTRPGGRVFTNIMEGDGFVGAAELGGSVLTGVQGSQFDGTRIQGNPLGVIARQLGLHLHKINKFCPLYHRGGVLVDDDMDRTVENQFNQLLDKANDLRKVSRGSENLSLGRTLGTLVEDMPMSAKETQLLDWHFANLEFGNASLLSNLSLANWDQDDVYEMDGDHCFLEGGNVQLVNALAEGLQIVYDTKVEEISYGSQKVVVTAGGKSFEGEFVVYTLPLGVLKQGRVKFRPELPERKLGAIRRLGFGFLNKVALLFPSAFWGEDNDTFGHVADHKTSRGEYFLFYSYRNVGAARSPLLIALVAGEAAMGFEHSPPTESAANVMSILREIFEPQGVSVPDPVQVVCTRWGKDPYACGSYSNVAVGSSGEDYDILAESVDGRLFFAGEATNRFYPATMHGAFLSGLREAGNISVSLRAGSSGEKSGSSGGDLASKASMFAEIFKKPDLEFGCVSVAFDPRTDDGSSSALLRVILSGDMHVTDKARDELNVPMGRMRTILVDQLRSLIANEQAWGTTQVIDRTAMHVYVSVTRSQALELMEVRGGDIERLRHLIEVFGVKLVGRKGVGG